MTFPKLQYFKASEFTHPDKMDHEFLYQLDEVRLLAGFPLIITSSYRTNRPESAHALGLAVDISDNKASLPVGSRWRYHVLNAALQVGINRIGIYDKHIHLDASTTHDQHVIWYGTSD